MIRSFGKFKRAIALILMLLLTGSVFRMVGQESPDKSRMLGGAFPEGPFGYSELINNSPFTRLIDPSLIYNLTGIATIGSENFVTYSDTNTGHSHLISSEPDHLGREILDIRKGDAGVEVEVSFPKAGKFVLSFNSALFVVFKGLSLNKSEVAKFRAVAKKKVMAPKKNEATPARLAILKARMSEFDKRNPNATPEEKINYWALVNEELGL